MYDIYSIDTKITNIDGSHNLVKRTEKPLELTEAISKAAKLEKMKHIICLLYTSDAADE